MDKDTIFWVDGFDGAVEGGYYIRNDLFKFFTKLRDSGKTPVGIRIDDSYNMEIIIAKEE